MVPLVARLSNRPPPLLNIESEPIQMPVPDLSVFVKGLPRRFQITMEVNSTGAVLTTHKGSGSLSVIHAPIFDPSGFIEAGGPIGIHPNVKYPGSKLAYFPANLLGVGLGLSAV